MLFPALTGAWLVVVGIAVGLIAFAVVKFIIGLAIGLSALILAPICGCLQKKKIRVSLLFISACYILKTDGDSTMTKRQLEKLYDTLQNPLIFLGIPVGICFLAYIIYKW